MLQSKLIPIAKHAYIGGKWFGSSQSYPLARVSDRANLLANVTNCTSSMAQNAIDAADMAQNAWGATSAYERYNLLMDLLNEVNLNEGELAKIIHLEGGKSLEESVGEVRYSASYIAWFAEEAKRSYGRVIPPSVKGTRIMTQTYPVGVCALITPFNFPLAMLARKIAPAIAAGCTIISKPSTETPLTAVAFYKLAEKVGFPEGVLNLLPADRKNSVEIGKVICESSKVRKISFTGSTAVGKKLLHDSASTVKRVSLELGGNAAFIVLKESSNEELMKSCLRLLLAKMRYYGQTCVSPNRVFVHESNLTEFVKIVQSQLERHTVGKLITEAATDKMKSLVSDAKSKGAEVIHVNRSFLLINCNDNMRVWNEECFSPIIPIFTYSSIEEAINMANDTNCGLAGYVSGSDLSLALNVSEKLKAGMIGVNVGIISAAQAPFGGIKESGLGREGASEGLKDYQDIKYTCYSI